MYSVLCTALWRAHDVPYAVREWFCYTYSYIYFYIKNLRPERFLCNTFWRCTKILHKLYFLSFFLKKIFFFMFSQKQVLMRAIYHFITCVCFAYNHRIENPKILIKQIFIVFKILVFCCFLCLPLWSRRILILGVANLHLSTVEIYVSSRSGTSEL